MEASSQGPDTRDAQADPVDARHRGDVEGLAVLVTPGEVVGALGEPEGAEVGSFGGEQPDAGRTADVEVAGLVDFDAVDGVLAGAAVMSKKTSPGPTAPEASTG
jgi:hypothetical protein